MSISLPRVSSAELLLFPETAEGHVSKVLKAMRACHGIKHRVFACGARHGRSLDSSVCCTMQ